MLELVLPAVIVPPAIVHRKVAPVSGGTEAVFPVELAQTADAALIVAFGSGEIVTVRVPLVKQPFALVTATFKINEAPVPAT
jgi:hypothetical protein